MKPSAFILVLFAGSLLLAGPAPAGELEISTDHQRLSNGGPDWSEQAVRWSQALGQRRQIDLTLLQASRFGLQDEQLQAGYSHALTPRLNATLDLSQSNTHRFLAQRSTGLMLQYELPDGWLVHGGVKSTAYDSADVGQTTLMLERYVGSFSWALAWRATRAFATDSQGGELRGSHYYGERNFIGISWAVGQEATPLGAGVLVQADVESVALTGRHGLDRKWALGYAVSSTRQGNFYSRSGVRVGLQYIF